MTLRYCRDDGDGIRYLEPTDRPLRSGDNISHTACASCRSKKVSFLFSYFQFNFLCNIALFVVLRIWEAH